jgi:hypothetical protein
MDHLALPVLASALVALPADARAQQDTHVMPHGMGADFVPPPNTLGGPQGIGDQRHGPSSADLAREMERRGSLDDAMRKVPDVTDAQRDSLRALEKRHGEVFRSYAVVLKAALDAAGPASTGPDVRATGMLRMTADSTRAAELTAARALLTSAAARSPVTAKAQRERPSPRAAAVRRRQPRHVEVELPQHRGETGTLPNRIRVRRAEDLRQNEIAVAGCCAFHGIERTRRITQREIDAALCREFPPGAIW